MALAAAELFYFLASRSAPTVQGMKALPLTLSLRRVRNRFDPEPPRGTRNRQFQPCQPLTPLHQGESCGTFSQVAAAVVHGADTLPGPAARIARSNGLQ